MRRRPRTFLITMLLGLPALIASAEDAINYRDHIRPVFQQSCFNCHNADKAKGGLDLTSYRAAMAGGSSGEIVVSKNIDESVLLGVMSHTLEPKMPPKGDKVADDQIKLVRQWIEHGLRETPSSSAKQPEAPRVDLSIGKAAVGRPKGPPIMPRDMPLGPIHHTPRPGPVSDIAGHPWSPIAAVTGQRQTLIYHTQTGELLGAIPFTYGQPETLRFSWTGKLLIVGGGVGGASGTAALYDVTTGAQVARVGDEVDAVLAADLDPTQRYAALGGPSKRVKGYDIATGELIYNLDKHTDWVTAIAFSPSGDYLASGDRNGGLHIWEAESGADVFRLDGHSDAVTALAWRYDGKVLASSSEDGQVKLWGMKEGKQAKAWPAHDGGVRSVAFAEDGRLVTTGRDQFVRVWDSRSNKQHEIKPFNTLGLSAAFDTSANVIVAGDLSGNLVRWSLQNDAQQVDHWPSNPPPIATVLSQLTQEIKAHQATLKQAQADTDQLKANAQHTPQQLNKSQARLATAQQSLRQAHRQLAKWQAAELRIKIEALQRERDTNPTAQAEIDALESRYRELREATKATD